MDINTQRSSGMINGMPPTSRNEKKIGPIVGALIIVLILIIASLYFFAQRLNNKNQVNNTPETAKIAENSQTVSAPIINDEDMQTELDNQLNSLEASF